MAQGQDLFVMLQVPNHENSTSNVNLGVFDTVDECAAVAF
eukprot:CAMPEP_0202705820 /NCGR_PEP_ID=MMETSP1385-20130828/18336_1 /ASSEMBLY_ACC=CAM_ASM_000861 /TAXON_ID=933848 /ORGANISM="Elphidium margaritaceum" /LENGTH=39 /DNA_ID= /DNA_START= /DNA_END= /DNA_ORIENTATION=